jgi:hypothetical protein
MKNQNVFTMIILAVLFAGGGFFAGLKYQQSKMPTLGQFAGDRVFSGAVGARGQAGQTATGRRGGFGGGQTLGEVVSKDNSSLTVKMVDGSSKIVILNDKTVYNKAEAGSVNDIVVGTKVGVFGIANTDGSVTAQNIQINPMIRQMDGTPAISPAPTK